MIKVRLFSDFGDSQFLLNHLKNQTPSLIKDTYKNLQFVCDDSYTHSVSFNRPLAKLKSPKENNIGFMMDLPFIYTPNMNELSEISRYFCWYKEHQNKISSIFVYIPFSYMLYHSPILQDNTFSMKNNRMSMVVSGKCQTPEQRKRLEIVEKLLQTPLNIDFYGRNFSLQADKRIKGSIPFMDKDKALKEYEYSICLENMVYDGWLTEKYYDCVINNCIPITNSPTVLSQINNQSYCYIDYSQSVENIVKNIENIYNNDNSTLRQSDLLNTKSDVINGKLSLCEKIWKEFN